jgi:hypothetical protein
LLLSLQAHSKELEVCTNPKNRSNAASLDYIY